MSGDQCRDLRTRPSQSVCTSTAEHRSFLGFPLWDSVTIRQAPQAARLQSDWLSGIPVVERSLAQGPNLSEASVSILGHAFQSNSFLAAISGAPSTSTPI
jgi:hypothetical protein